MGEIIKVKNTSYARYEELLMQRDNLKKEAFIMQRNYVAEFGDLILEVFEKKLECIRKKKTIEYAQTAINRGKTVSQEELQSYLERELAEFRQQLNDMILDNESAKKREIVTEHDMLKIKRIYHRLVKLIHPDINPVTNENETLSELWQRVQVAYNCNNLKDMEELELLVTAAIEKMDIGIMEIDIPNIEDKISEVEAEILKIRETDPYMYKYILEDAAAVEDKKESLRAELKSYEDYSIQLDNILEGLLKSGVSFTWQMN